MHLTWISYSKNLMICVYFLSRLILFSLTNIISRNHRLNSANLRIVKIVNFYYSNHFSFNFRLFDPKWSIRKINFSCKMFATRLISFNSSIIVFHSGVFVFIFHCSSYKTAANHSDKLLSSSTLNFNTIYIYTGFTCEW